MITRKLQQNKDNQFPLNLPFRDIQLLGWVKGEELFIETDIVNDRMTIKRIR